MKTEIEEQQRAARVAKRLPQDTIQTHMLEFLPYEYRGNTISIETTTDEFTSVCPMTGLPDFGRLHLIYVPDATIVELKSLKYYLFQYREVGVFYEHLVNKVLEDLWQGLQPASIEVHGVFTPRGGLQTTVKASRNKK